MVKKDKRTLELEAIAKDKTAPAFKRLQARAQLFGLRMAKIARRISKLFFNVRTAIAGIGAAFAFDRIIDGLDELNKNARRLNLPVDAFNELRFAAELAGVETQRFTAGMRFFQTRLVEAANGSGQLAETFGRFGVQLRDSEGNLRTTEKILSDLADGYASLPAGAERAAFAVKLFGEENSKLATLIEGGSDALRRAREEGEFFLGSVSHAGKVAEDFNDAMTRLKASLGSVFREAVVALAERFTESINNLAVLVARNRQKIIQFLFDLGRLAGQLFDTFISGVTRLQRIAQGVKLIGIVRPFESLANAAKRAEARVAASRAAIVGFRKDIASVQRQAGFGLSGDALKQATTRLKQLRSQLSGANAEYRRNAAELVRVQDAIASSSVGERFLSTWNNLWAEFEARGMNAANSVGETIVRATALVPKSRLRGFWDGFFEGANEIAEQLSNAFELGKEVAQDFFSSIENGITGEISQLIQGTQSLGDAWDNFRRRFLSIAADIIARLVAIKLIQAALSLFSGGGSGVVGALTTNAAGNTISRHVPNNLPDYFGSGSISGLGESGQLSNLGASSGGNAVTLNVNVNQNIQHPDGEALGRALKRNADGISTIVAQQILERPEVRAGIRGAR